MVSSGAITRYAEDLEPISVALVKPEKIHLLDLDREVIILHICFILVMFCVLSYVFLMQVDAKNLNYFYVLEPGDPRISPMCSELKDAMRKVVRLIKQDKGFQNSPQEVIFYHFSFCFYLKFSLNFRRYIFC